MQNESFEGQTIVSLERWPSGTWGVANTQLGKKSDAKQAYTQALQLDPNDPYALMGLGLLAYREADFPTAVDFFSRNATVAPSDFDYLLLANALQKAGRQADASAASAHAEEISKDWSEAQNKVQWFLNN